MKVFRLTAFCILFLLTSCTPHPDSGNPPPYSPATYQEQKLTLEQQEKQTPLQFLTSKGTYRQNFWGDFVLEGTITNSATVATYKDAVLEVSFYTQTNTLLGTKQFSLYEYYPPGTSKPFKLKVAGLAGTSSVGWTIVRASNN